MPTIEDTKAALEAEKSFYEAKGNKDRAKQVQDQLDLLAAEHPEASEAESVTDAPDTAADDPEAVDKKPAPKKPAPKTRRKRS